MQLFITFLCNKFKLNSEIKINIDNVYVYIANSKKFRRATGLNFFAQILAVISVVKSVVK